MAKNPVLSVPLEQVMRPEIAITLRHVLQLHTVGSFLKAWSNPRNHERIERLFDSPEQARHAAAVCAGWLGCRSTFTPIHEPLIGWWRSDESASLAA